MSKSQGKFDFSVHHPFNKAVPEKDVLVTFLILSNGRNRLAGGVFAIALGWT